MPWDDAPPTPQELAPQVPIQKGDSWEDKPPTPQELAAPRLAQLQAMQAQLKGLQQAPGALASGALGAEQGATMSFAPRINAALKAAGQTLIQPSLQDQGIGANFAQHYTENKKDQEELMNKAKATHPWAYGAGELAGGVGGAMVTGGAGAGLKGAMEVGAGLGAANALGQSEDLTDLPADAKNVAMGGGAGAILGAGTSLVAPLAKAGYNTAKGAAGAVKDVLNFPTMTKNFAAGLAGDQTIGSTARSTINQRSLGQLASAQQIIQDDLNSASQQAQASRNASTGIDIGDWARHIQDMADNAKSFTPLDADHQAIDKVLNTVQAFTDKSGTVLSPAEAIYLKRVLGAMGSEGESSIGNDYGRSFINRIMSPLNRAPNDIERQFGQSEDFMPLKSTINDAIDGLDPANKKMSQLLNAQDSFPKSLGDLVASQKSDIVGTTKANGLQDFLGQLPQETRAKVEPMLNDAANSSYLTERVNAAGLNKGIVPAETGSGLIGGASNLAGLAVRGVGQAAKSAASETANQVSQSYPGKLFSTMVNATPQSFSDMGAQLVQAPNAALQYVGKALQGAASKDQVGRNAVIFALTQNPAYRDAVEKHFGNGEGIEQNGPASSVSQLVNQPQ